MKKLSTLLVLYYSETLKTFATNQQNFINLYLFIMQNENHTTAKILLVLAIEIKSSFKPIKKRTVIAAKKDRNNLKSNPLSVKAPKKLNEKINIEKIATPPKLVHHPLCELLSTVPNTIFLFLLTLMIITNSLTDKK